MEGPTQIKKKRKGISVSLTPDKKNVGELRNLCEKNIPSPRNQKILLGQSFAMIKQETTVPKYVRIVPAMRPLDQPNVRFTYSNASKQQQIRQSIALDQELHVLKKQLQNKKSTIQNLQTNRSQFVTSNVRAVYSLQQSKRNHQYQNHRVETGQNNLIPNQQHSPQIQPITQIHINTFTPSPMITQFKHKTQIKQQNDYKAKVQNILISEQEKGLNAQKNFNNLAKINNEKTPIKNPENVKEEIPSISKKIEKQNNKALAERMQKLKWAEQKLIQIIKICDNGL